MTTIRLTAAQACVRYIANQYVETDAGEVPYFAGVWAIFGHGNVAGLGEALEAAKDDIPIFRAHNEQAMAHSAIAFAKQVRRQRAMVCTSSIGPGATNMVTAAALAHVNRLPVLFLPGDVYATRRPDPVLQQLEDFTDGTASVNDCFRPVSRYFDRLTRPEQLLDALPRAVATMIDPASCGPATLAFCQDVQAEAFDYPGKLLRQTCLADPASRSRCAGNGGPRQASPLIRFPAHRRGRRRPLFRRLCRAAGLCEPGGHSGRRNAGRQGCAALGSSAGTRQHRSDGNKRRQCRSRRGRPDHRPGYPASGFHDRLLGTVRQPGVQDRSGEHRVA